MTRKSGMYNYLELCLKQNTLATIIDWSAQSLVTKTDQRRYYVLFNPEASAEPNPFNNQNYVLEQGSAFVPHLSFYEFFHAGNAENIHLRDLSYCHGTEYFSYTKDGSQKRLTVHYHFNIHGRYMYPTCRDEDGNKLEITPQQSIIFRQRSHQYQEAFQQLLEKKHSKYLSLAEEIEKAKDHITAGVTSKKIKKSDVLEKCSKLSAMNVLKDRISDLRKSSRAGFEMFLGNISRIIDGATVEANIQETSKIEETQHVEELSTKLEQVALTAAMVVTKRTTADDYLSTISELENTLTNLIRQQTLINNRYPVEELAKYLNDLVTLRNQVMILSLEIDPKLKSVVKRVEVLFDRVNKLKTAEQIFQAAVNNLNLGHIEVSFEFCSHTVSYKTFNNLLDEWRVACRDLNVKRCAKIKTITDFLSERSDSFSVFIKMIAQTISVDDGGNGVSSLALAYTAENKEMFSALLDYGMSVSTPWLYQNGDFVEPLRFMLRHPVQDTFYFEQLMAYGLQFDKVYKIQALNSKRTSSTASDVLANRQRKEVGKIERSITGMGMKVFQPAVANMPGNNRSVTCVFINATGIFCNDEKNLVLYAAFAKKCALSSLLFSAAMLATKGQVAIKSISSSRKFGLALTNNWYDLFPEVFGLHDAEQPRNILNCIDVTDPNINPIVLKRLAIIVDEIKNRFPESLQVTDLLPALAELQGYARLTTSLQDHKLEAKSYIAMIFLFGLKGQLTDDELLNCVDLWRKAGMAKLKEQKAYKNRAVDLIRDGKLTFDAFRLELPQINEDFLFEACMYFTYAIQLAYYSPSEPVIASQTVADCFKQLEDIFKFEKFSEAALKRMSSMQRSPEEWQDMREKIKISASENFEVDDDAEEEQELEYKAMTRLA